MDVFRFEKLDAWQAAVDLAKRVYDVTADFPVEERYGISAQLWRAAISISSNLAEGSGPSSDKDFAHFTQIAYGSLMEAVSQMRIAERRHYIPSESHKEFVQHADRLARMLSGLRASLLRK